MDKTQINVERMRACDAEWEEQKHPRAENGQFTSGSGSAGGASKPSAEPAAGSPLKKAAANSTPKKAATPKNSKGTKYEHIAKLESLKSQAPSPDAKIVIWNLVNDLEERNMDIESAFDKEDKVVEAGNIGGPKSAQNELRKWWKGFKSDYFQSAPNKSGKIIGYKGKTYTQGITGAAANTPAGEVHNLIVGRIESANPTKAEIAEAAWYIADEDLNDNVRRCREMVQKFERAGNSYAAKAWGDALKDAKKKVEICKEIAKSMSAKDSASPLQQAAAILQSE